RCGRVRLGRRGKHSLLDLAEGRPVCDHHAADYAQSAPGSDPEATYRRGCTRAEKMMVPRICASANVRRWLAVRLALRDPALLSKHVLQRHEIASKCILQHLKELLFSCLNCKSVV